MILLNIKTFYSIHPFFMKIKRIELLILLFLTHLNIEAQVYISGKITGNVPEQHFIYSPINGFANNTLIKDEAVFNIDSCGQFRFTLDLNDPCFVTLKIGYEPIWLLLQPNDSLNIKINLDSLNGQSHHGWLQMTGNNSSGHLFFNEYNFQPYKKLVPITELFESLKPKQVNLIQAIKDTISKALKPFDKLLRDHSISSEYYKIVSNSIKASLLNEALKYFFRGSTVLYSVYTMKEIEDLKKEIFSLCNPLDTVLYKGWNTEFYLYNFYLQNELTDKQKVLGSELKDSILIISENKKLLIHADATPFLYIKNNRLKEHLWGSMLYGMNVSANTYPDIQSIESFKFFFPESPWLTYLNRLVAIIKEKQIKSRNNFEEIKYLDSTQSINSFADIIGQFKNRPLFIDIWASWCIPCRQEFLNNNKVDSFLSEQNIVRVYISMDLPMAMNSWKNEINMYDLKGYHILAGPKLQKDIMNKIYDGNDKYTIPRYMIINKNGIIVEKDALRPSDGKKLIKQLKEKLF